jgi:hypothetical protein
MNSKEFVAELGKVRELMNQQKYTNAQKILNKLKNIENDLPQDINYDLIHQLYQLDSNSKSIINQQKILKVLEDLLIKTKSITFTDLNHALRDNEILRLSEEVLRREVELLILRNKLNCRINKDTIIL